MGYVYGGIHRPTRNIKNTEKKHEIMTDKQFVIYVVSLVLSIISLVISICVII